MKQITRYLTALLACLLLGGCAAPETGTTPPETSSLDAIPFADGQSYAVAYLGYQTMEALDQYVGSYLDSSALPVHYLSPGDFYLVIPRYSGMALALYRNDIETMDPVLVYEDPDCRPFVLQCNVSDIFADATLHLTYQGETVEFSPFLSLQDGSLDIGDRGLDLTKHTEDQSGT